MTAVDPPIASPPTARSAGSPVGVFRWRRERLVDAGFEPALATALAGEPQIDLHAILQLLDRGCPPLLAARILAPIPGSLGGMTR